MNSVNSMRDTVDDFRYRWLSVRIGGPDATLQGHWAVLSVSLLVVFACFFAVGRLGIGGGGGGSTSAAPSALVGPSGQPGIPAGLSGGSPIAGAVPVSIAVKPRRRAAQPVARPVRAAAPSQARPVETARTETPAPAGQPAPAPAPEPAPTKVSAPAPKPATKVSAPAPAPTKVSRPAPTPTKAAAPAPSGPSFETSE
jgi:hypothetical protein